jgi:hypothetical protein
MARAAVDEGHLRLRLGVVLDGDALAARERSDHDVDLVLLDQLAGRVDRDVGLGIGRSLDDHDLPAGDDAVALLDRELGAAHAVGAPGRERSLERGQQADLDRLTLLGPGRTGQRDRRRGAQRRTHPDSLALFHFCLLGW